ncbi:MAG TPA: ECF-type sigma factor [Phycisphaerae bacterium]|nr:ECF-type sigma factor [Phycisphaerae bacterium]
MAWLRKDHLTAGDTDQTDSSRGLPDAMEAVYEELRQVAANYLRYERPGHTLQTTALLHEAYVRLAEQCNRRWSSRADFCAAASQAIRRVLIDYARGHRAAKRGGPNPERVLLDAALLTPDQPSVDLLDLDQALKHLAALSERQARVVELRYFGGLAEEETAETLGVSRRTVQKDWRLARAWLLRELGRSS